MARPAQAVPRRHVAVDDVAQELLQDEVGPLVQEGRETAVVEPGAASGGPR